MDKNYRFLFGFLGGISLVLGGLIYIFFRRESYVSILFYEIFNIENKEFVESGSFVGIYLGDFLWAFSFSLFLHMIYLPTVNASFVLSSIVVIMGVIYEICQSKGFISGTGDIIDALIYLFAAFAVNILNFTRRQKNEKQKII